MPESVQHSLARARPCVQGPVEQALIQHRVLQLLHAAAASSSHVWTQRAACKAIVSLIRNPRLLSAAGLSLDTVIVTLEAAGKQDFMCARWAREAERWRRNPQPRKWYE